MKCIVYDKLLKHRQSFQITLYFKMTLNLSDIGMTQHMMLLIWNLNILVLT